MPNYPLTREYLSSRLDTADSGEAVTIAESERRLRCEPSYGFVHLIWIIALADGTRAASLPVDAAPKLKAFLRDALPAADITSKVFIRRMKKYAKAEAKRLFGKKQFRKRRFRCYSDLMFACDAATLAPENTNVRPQRITEVLPCSEDIHLPARLLPDGIVYGIINDNTIVSIAYAHQTGEYRHLVADIGVETSKQQRKKGYARACVRAVAQQAIDGGGESLYKCSPENTASIHTAQSAGYQPYGKSLIFSVAP